MTMQNQLIADLTAQKRVPWNKGKLTGAKPPLRPKHVWSIRTKLQIEGRARELIEERAPPRARGLTPKGKRCIFYRSAPSSARACVHYCTDGRAFAF
jgi:hypothetical protein